MKNIILYFSLLFIVYSNNFLQKEMILSQFKDAKPKMLFQVYHNLFNKNQHYDINSEEGIRRYKIFKSNLKSIKQFNEEAGSEIYGITHLSDLTDEEYESMLNKSFDMKANEEINHNQKLNVQLDWTPYMQNPKNQKHCGSCWAFAAMGAVEGNYKIQFGESVNFSEQYLVDCDENDNGCHGGYPSRTFDWLKDNGVLNGSHIEYLGQRTYCSSKSKKEALNVVKEYKFCEKCDITEWKELISKGPIVVGMDASGPNFKHYKPKNGEAYIPSRKCNKPNHAVLAVGIEKKGDEEYIIVRNSWSEKWGINGYFKIPVKSHCFIMNAGYLPIVQKHVPFESPSCFKFYSDCNKTKESYSTCNGISDFREVLGGKAVSYDSKSDMRVKFFDQPNCLGSEIEIKNNSCANFDMKKIASFTNEADKPTKGCLHIYEESCFNGDKFRICESISDLTITPIAKINSLYLDPSNKKDSLSSVIFFEDKNYQGKGYGVHSSNLFNLEGNKELQDVIKNAKSILLVNKK